MSIQIMSKSLTVAILQGCVLFVMLSVLGCSDSKNVASVGGKDITTDQFAAYLKFKRINPKDEAQRAKIMDAYLERMALGQVIEKQSKLDAALIKAELDEFKNEMLLSRYFEEFLKDAASEEAVTNYYAANANQYEQSKAKAAHILLRTTSNMNETEKKAKLTTVQAAYSQLKAGKAFADVAKEFSEDANSSKKGGDLGWVKQGSISKEFSEKLFALKPSEYTEPFETAFGYHIVYLEEGPAVVKQPFDAVKGDIRFKLRNKAKQAEMDRLKALVTIKKK